MAAPISEGGAGGKRGLGRPLSQSPAWAYLSVVLRLARLPALVLPVFLTACISIGQDRIFLPPDRSGLERPPLSIRDGENWREADGALWHVVEAFGDQSIAFSGVGLAEIDPGKASGHMIAPATRDRPLILYCGGTAFDRVGFGKTVIGALLPMGDPVIWDYPGYGDSPGVPDIAALRALAPDMAAWIDDRAADRNLVLWGYSLGGAVCAEIATHSDAVDLLVLEASIDKGDRAVRALVRERTGLPLPVRIDPAIGAIDVGAMLADFSAPMLLLVSGDDKVVPARQQLDLAAALGAGPMAVDVPPRAFQLFEGAGHYDLLGSAAVAMIVGWVYDTLGWEILSTAETPTPS